MQPEDGGELQLDKTQYCTVYGSNNSYILVDGMHRMTAMSRLFVLNVKFIYTFRGVLEWPCRIIPDSENLSPLELDNLSEWLNESHDEGSIHATFWERLMVVQRRIQFPQFKTPKGINFDHLSSSFVSNLNLFLIIRLLNGFLSPI
jgi:hypothetical protein